MELAGEFNNPKGICSASLALDWEPETETVIPCPVWSTLSGNYRFVWTHLCRDASLLQSREIRVAPMATRPGRHVAQVLIKAASGKAREREKRNENENELQAEPNCAALLT